MTGFSFGPTAAAVLLFALLFVTEMEIVTTLPRGMRTRRSEWKGVETITTLGGVSLVMGGGWCLLTLLEWAMAHLSGSSVAFEALFCILFYSSLPAIAGWLALPFSHLTYSSYNIWKVGMAALMSWTTASIWLGLHAGCHLDWWKTIVAGLPFLALSWTAVVCAGRALPFTFAASYRWQRTVGQHVTVFTPRGKSREELEAIVRGCDETMEQAARLLWVEPPAFKVPVFLFPDADLHHRVTGTKPTDGSGFSFGDSFNMVYDKWDAIHSTVAHELCHVLCAQRITKNLMSLLSEGLSEYIQQKIAPDDRQQVPAVTIQTPLRVLAYPEVFFEWRNTTEPAYSSSAYYAQAHAFAGYLIDWRGMGKYKELCRLTDDEQIKDPGRRLARAIHMVYEMPLDRLERQWRQCIYERRMSRQEEVVFNTHGD